MGRWDYRYDSEGRKMCTGPLHREGVYLPQNRFHIHKSGRRQGHLYAVCKQCWAVQTNRDPDNVMVDRADFMPIFNRLVKLLGSQAELARRLGVSDGAVTKMKQSETSVRRGTYDNALKLLQEIDFNPRGHGTQGEAQVVNGLPLSEVLRKWVVKWYAERDQQEILNGEVVGPIQYLSFQTDIHVRRISMFVNYEIPYPPLSQVEKVLMAIDREYMLTNGEIEVIANPNWTYERWLRHMGKQGCV